MSDARCHRRTFHAPACHKYEYGIERNVDNRSQCHAKHRGLHLANRLKQLFKRHSESNHGRKCHDHVEIVKRIAAYHVAFCEQLDKRCNATCAHRRKYDAVHRAQNKPQSRGSVCRVILFCAHIEGHCRAYAHAKAHAHRNREILHGKYERNRRHCVFADFGHEYAVHKVVKRIDDHGQHHRQRHLGNQRNYRLFFHKRIVHISLRVYLYFCSCFSFLLHRQAHATVTICIFTSHSRMRSVVMASLSNRSFVFRLTLKSAMHSF